MKKLLTLLAFFVASCSPLPAQNTLAGNLTVQQSVKFTGDITPPQLTADVDDYAPASFSAATFLRVAADAPRVITGLAGGADGRIVWLSNIGGYPISLAHAFTGSAAANRFDLGGANYELAAGNGLGLWYDATAARWRPLSGLAAGGGGGGTGTVTSVAVTTANGVSAAVANPTTTPTLTFSLGAITPSSVAATGNVTGANLTGTNTGDQSDATLTFSDVTTNNVSTMRHGFAPKLPNDAAKYLDGTGAWSTPAGGGGSGTVTSVSVVSANGVSGSVANASTTPAITLSIGAIAPTSVAATGTVTGSNLSGTNTGDQTSVAGNAGTATALQTARTINGVSFDGTANITVPAAAGTLTGSTLASGVTASSLTSAAGGTFGTAAFTAATAYDPAGAAAAITLAGLGGVPTSRTVNGHALSSNVSVTAGDVGLGSVENTALSTWAGTPSITTLGTITAGTWHGTAIADTYIASAAAWNAKVSFPGFGTTGTTAAVGNDSRLSDARTPTAHNQAWSTITSTPTTLIGYGITDAQSLDADLTAIAGLSATGLVARTGAGTAATRTIIGTANQVTVTNGDGISGDPTLALPQSIATTSTPQFSRLGVGQAADAAMALSVTGDTTISGDMRVGTTTTGRKLTVSGNGIQIIGTSGTRGALAAEGTTITLQADSSAATRFLIDAGAANTAGYVALNGGSVSGYIQFAIGGAERMRIATAGGIRFNAYGAGTLVTDSSGNVTASSDASLKTVTGTFTRGLADVLKLTPRTYHWNEKSGMDTEDENVGFIAQEVLESIPEAVGQYRTSEVEVDGKKIKKREKAELLTLSDRPLIAALVNAVRELNEKNTSLEARVAALENGKASK